MGSSSVKKTVGKYPPTFPVIRKVTNVSRLSNVAEIVAEWREPSGERQFVVAPMEAVVIEFRRLLFCNCKKDLGQICKFYKTSDSHLSWIAYLPIGSISLEQNWNWHGECNTIPSFQRRQVWWLLERAKVVEPLLESCRNLSVRRWFETATRARTCRDLRGVEHPANLEITDRPIALVRPIFHG